MDGRFAKGNGAWLLASLSVLFSGCQHPVVTDGVPNLAEVAPGVWRGGQPTPEGWQYLKSIGVSNVVKLNEEREASDVPAEELGMCVFRHPINLREQLIGRVDKLGLELAVSHIGTNGVYVHCEHGQDRTGLVIAVYRVSALGWSKADAEKEMLAHGFHRELHGLHEFWENYKP